MTLSTETQASLGLGAPLPAGDAQFPLAAPESEVSLFVLLPSTVPQREKRLSVS